VSYFTTNLAAPNSYYEVVEPINVLELVGHKPGNHWYGASRIYDPVYKPLELKVGGILMNLHGGVFFADSEGQECRPVVMLENPKSPFEKRYSPDYHEWPLESLRPTNPIQYVYKNLSLLSE
jgi:hypothetical protein